MSVGKKRKEKHCMELELVHGVLGWHLFFPALRERMCKLGCTFGL
jgi:hypothetical protein